MPEAVELERVLPVIEGLRDAGCEAELSIDTSKAAVASAALAAGATLVNDVTALRGDPSMAAVVAGSGARCCLMHMLGEPRTMQRDPCYDEVVADVRFFLEARMGFAIEHGIAEDRILLDPGIGFGKTVAHNLELLRRLDEIAQLGRPVVIGTSRKSFLGEIAGGREADDRLAGTIATNVIAYERGASVFRVHDVAAIVDALARGCCYGACAMAQDDDEFDDADDVDDEDPEGAEPEVTIEVSGLSLYTHVGVTAAEREVGQRLLIDLRIDVGDCDATITDRIEDTVDYGQVCEVANLVAQQRNYKTLERLCTAIADRILSQWDVSADLGQGRQARAAAGAAGHRGVGRGLARGRPGHRRLSR